MQYSTKISAALIDMDGTLYDSMPSHARAWHILFGELGLDLPYEEFFLYEGMTGGAIIDMLMRRHLGRGADVEEQRRLYARKAELFNSMPTVPVMEGAQQMVEEMMSLGIKRVLVTGSGQRSLLDRLMRDFPGGFSEDLMITSHDVVHGKPSPEPYLLAMKKAGVSADNAIVVENAPLGVESGHKSGAYTVAVATGPIPHESLKASGADVVYESMNAFAKDFRNFATQF